MCTLFKGLWCSRLQHLDDGCSIKHYTGSDRSLCLGVGDFFQACDEIILGTSEEVSTIRQRRRTCLVLVTKELLKVSIPRLAANVQACEEFTIILDGGELLLTFALASWSWSAEHLQLVTRNGVVHCLCSVHSPTDTLWWKPRTALGQSSWHLSRFPRQQDLRCSLCPVWLDPDSPPRMGCPTPLWHRRESEHLSQMRPVHLASDQKNKITTNVDREAAM